MKKQIENISIHQSSKVIAIIYFVITAVFAIPWGIYMLFATGMGESLVIFLLPFLYMLFGYCFFAIFAFIYNFVAKTFGGVEFTFTGDESVESFED